MFLLVQVVNGNVSIIEEFSTHEEAVSHLNELTRTTINGLNCTIQSVIENESQIKMDGFYLKPNNDKYEIIERQTQLLPGYFYNSIQQVCYTVGNFQIVPFEHQLSSTPITRSCPRVTSLKQNKPQQHFSPELIKEFMLKVNQKKNKIEGCQSSNHL